MHVLETLLREYNIFTHIRTMRLFVGNCCGLDLVHNHEKWILTDESVLRAELLIDITKRDVRRVILKKAHARMTGNSDWHVKVQIALMALFLTRQNTRDMIRRIHIY